MDKKTDTNKDSYYFSQLFNFKKKEKKQKFLRESRTEAGNQIAFPTKID